MALSRHILLLLLILLYGLTTAPAGLSVLTAMLAVPLIWASLADLERQVIPDASTALVAGFGLLAPLMAGHSPDPITILIAVLAVAVLAKAGDIYWRRHGAEALGLGDAKLIGAGILVVGAERAWLMILLATVGGILAALLARRRGELGIPFGPFLAYSIFSIATLAGEEAL